MQDSKAIYNVTDALPKRPPGEIILNQKGRK